MLNSTKKIILTISAIILAAALALGIAFMFTDFSSGALVAKAEGAATVNGTSYDSIEDAWTAAQSDSESSQGTVTLTDNVKLTSSLTLSSGMYVTLDLAGYTIDSSGASYSVGFYDIQGTLTIKDSTETWGTATSGSAGVTKDGNGYKTTFSVTDEETGQSSLYWYKSGAITGGSNKSTSYYGAVMLTGSGVLNMYGGTVCGNTYYRGGAVSLAGSSVLNMYGGSLSGNSSDTNGGAVFMAGTSSAYVSGGVLSSNSAVYSGGAIDYESNGTLYVGRYSSAVSSDSYAVMSGNSAQNGGAIHAQYSGDTVYLYAGIFLTGNSSAEKGGAIDSNGTLYMYDGATISGNTCVTFGGGVYNNGRPFYMYGGTISFNSSTAANGNDGNGGGVSMDAGAMYMYGGNISRNSTASSGAGGAGIFATGSGADIYMYDGAVINGNTAAENGGGVMIDSYATLTMNGGEISGNSSRFGGGFYSSTVNPSGNVFRMYDGAVISGNTSTEEGGGLYLYGPAYIYGGEISGNSSKLGGGICLRTQKLTMTGGTISKNSSSSLGGGIYMYDKTSTAELSDCAVSYNYSSASGGGIYMNGAGASLTLKNCEISQNGASSAYGGVAVRGSVKLSGKIYVKDNYVGGDYETSNLCLFSGYTVTLGGNFDDGSYVGVTLLSSSQTQITSTESSTSYYNKDIRYFHLDDLKTYRNEKYIFYGTNCLVLDGIGDYRARVDFLDGTTKFYTSVSLAVRGTTSRTADARDTIVLLKDVNSSGHVTFGDSYYKLDINGFNFQQNGQAYYATRGGLDIYDTTDNYRELDGEAEVGVTIAPDGRYVTTYRKTDPDSGEVRYYTYTSAAFYGTSDSTDDFHGPLYVQSGGTMNFYGGTVTDNNYPNGSGISVVGNSAGRSTLNIYGGSISGNYNGGIYVSDGDVYIYGGIITSNVRTDENYEYNGGICLTDGSTLYIGTNKNTIVSPVISDNKGYLGVISVTEGCSCVVDAGTFEFNSAYDGGVFYIASGATLIMNGGYVGNNSAEGSGGAFCVDGGGLDVNGGQIYGNSSLTSTGSSYSYGGGAIFVTGGGVTVNGGLIDGNSALGYGGAILVVEGEITVSGGEISENSAVSAGGAISMNNSTMYLYDGEISSNMSDEDRGYGGGVYGHSSVYHMYGGTISDNVANYAGGVYLTVGSVFEMSDGFITGNQSDRNMGGLYVNGDGVMYGGVISGNTAGHSGAGVEFNDGEFTMYGGYIVGNSAGENGGGVYLFGSGSSGKAVTFTMYGGEISGNEAAGYGGGIYSYTNSSYVINIYGGEISGNTAGKAAAGIDDGSAESASSSHATINMSGTVVVSGNTIKDTDTEQNVYLSSDSSSLINLKGTLETGSSVGVTLSGKTQVTSTEVSTDYYLTSLSYFYLDDEAYSADHYVGYKNGSYLEVLEKSNTTSRVDYYDGTSGFFDSFANALGAAVYTSESYANTLTLIADVNFTDYGYDKSEGYVVEAGTYLDLDLNGNTLYLSSSNNKAFTVYGTLNLYDSTAVNEKVDDSQGFGVTSNGDGTYTTYYKLTDEETLVTSTYAYTSGAIAGGNYTGTSGAYYGTTTVYAGGTFNMYGGSIVNNTQHCAGGIYMTGSSDEKAAFTMYGGSISGNTSKAPGGAIRAYNSDIYLYGGIMVSNVLTGNSDTTYAQGGAIQANSGTYVYVADDSPFDVPVVLSSNTKVALGGAIYFGSDSSALIEGGHYEYNTSTYEGGAFYIDKSAGDITIAGGIIAHNSASYSGGAMFVRSDLTMAGGTVYDNLCTSTSYGGGGMRVADGAVFTMTGGRITSNEARGGYGGGVAVYVSTFLMYGGEISENFTSVSSVNRYGFNGNGGGVYLEGSDFVMEGGYISDNSTTGSQGPSGENKVNVGGGIYARGSSTINIYDGYIVGNSSTRDGGGIYSLGEINMYGGVVALNSASSSGGGVYAHGTTFTMYGGVIYGNSSSQSSYGGGGVCLYYSGTLVVYGGEILENTSTGYGGGVYAGSTNGVIYLYGGTITGNTAVKGGAGIYAPRETYVSGGIVVSGNTTGGMADDVYLSKDDELQYTLTLSGELTYGALIGVYLADSSQTQITAAEDDTAYYLTSYRYFDVNNLSSDAYSVGYSSNGRYVELVTASNSVARVDYYDGTYKYETSLKQAFDDALQTEEPTLNGTNVVTLLKSVDWETEIGSDGYDVASGYCLTVDLCGNTMTLSSAAYTLFTVEGTLTLYDSRDSYKTYTGSLVPGVYDNGDGTFTTIYGKSDAETYETSYYSYTSGGITGSPATGYYDRGAVRVNAGGTFNMLGGTITGNSYGYAGGVYIFGDKNGDRATFNMYGGSISGNTVSYTAGAVFASYGDMNIYGGIFAFGGTNKDSGGALYLLDTSVLKLGDTLEGDAADYVKETPVIYANEANTHGAGIAAGPGTEIYIYRANIEYNSSPTYGGIFANGGIYIYDGAFIAYNSSDQSAGAVYSGETFTMYGGTIYANEAGATNYGGGAVYLKSGNEAYVYGGLISANVSAGYGGAFYVDSDATLALYGGVITGNSAARNGGGVYLLGDISVSGTVVVSGNTSGKTESNVYLISGKYITLDGALTEGSSIGVSFESDSQLQITSRESNTTRYATSARYFFLDDPGDYEIWANTSSGYVQRTMSVVARVDFADGFEYYSSFDAALAAATASSAESCGTLVLVTDVEMTTPYTVEEGKYLSIDFSGHAIRLSGNQAFIVKGTMTLSDSAEKYEFNISYGGNECVEDNGDGTFTTYYSTIANTSTGAKAWNSYTSGGITGYYSDSNSYKNEDTYGAISVTGYGSLTMHGGSVVNNSGYRVGAIEVDGSNYSDGDASFVMYGGSISGNYVTWYGAVIIKYGTGDIYGGIFAANWTDYNCAVLVVSTKANVTLGTDDESILSALSANNPDAYRCGVVLSGNFSTSINSTATIIVMSNSSQSSLRIYDRVEISSNTTNSNNYGVIGAGPELYFYGGSIVYNTAPRAVYLSYQVDGVSASFFGDALVAHNFTEDGTECNVCIRYAVTTIYVDEYFYGTIGVTKSLDGGTATVTTAQAGYGSVKGHVVSDAGYCTGLKDGGICFFSEHGVAVYELVLNSDGTFSVYGVCPNCGEVLEVVTEVKVTVSLDGTGEWKATATLDGGTECSCVLDGGFVVTTGEESDWYFNATDAFAALEDGSTMTLLDDVSGEFTIEKDGVTLDLNGSTIYGTVEITSQNVEIKSNGGTISGNLSVYGGSAVLDLAGATFTCEIDLGNSGSLTIVDSSATEDCPLGTGVFAAEIFISVGSELTLQGGTYGDVSFAENYMDVTGSDDTGNYSLYVSSDGTATVVSSDCDEYLSTISVAYTEMTTDDGVTVRYYYESIEDAIEAVNKDGGKLVLCADAEVSSKVAITSAVEIDLGGHTFTAEITINAGAGYDENKPVSLTMTDSSDDGTGLVFGTITVTGESEDVKAEDDGGKNSYSSTLSIAGSAVSSDSAGLYVNLDGLTSSEGGENFSYFFTPETDEEGNTVYVISTEHEHKYTIPEWTLNADGTLELRFMCSCGRYLTSADGSVTVYQAELTVSYDTYSGKVSYTSTVTIGEGENAGTYTYENTITPVIMIEYTTGEGDEKTTETLYFETEEEALAYLEELFEDGASGIEMTLLGGADLDGLTVEGELTVNLNGFEMSGDVTVAPDGSLTVKNDTEAKNASYDELISGESGKVTGTVDVESTGEEEEEKRKTGDVSVTGGTYSDEAWEEYIADGFAPLYGTNGEYTVVPADEIADDAAASITRTVDGEEVTSYYSSLSAALERAEDGDTVVILSDIEEDDVIAVYGENAVTIDLCGNTVTADITVSGSSSLTITDSSLNGDGILAGTLSGSGDITVDSGKYTSDVGAYVADGYVLYAVESEDYGVIYEVVSADDDRLSGAEAKITYTAADGSTVTVYYENLTDAAAALSGGDTLTLLDDVDLSSGNLDISVSNVTLDLNGHTLTGGVAVEAGASLTISDSSASYDIVSDSYDSGSGSVTGTVSVDVNGSLTVEGGTYYADVSAYVDSGNGYAVIVGADDNAATTYTVVPEREARSRAAASVVYTYEDGNDVTVYFESVSDAVKYACGISDGATLTLYEDVPAGIEIDSGSVTLDINGHVVGGMTVGEDASLLIKGDGLVDGTITAAGTLEIFGGTYTDENVYEYVAESMAIIAETEDGKTYYEVTESASARRQSETNGTKAAVTVTTEDGDEVTIYFDDMAEAFAFANGVSDNSAGGEKTVKVTLCDDISTGDFEGTLTIGDEGDASANITIDLNGHTIETGISVDSDSSLTIEGEGIVSGGINSDETGDETDFGDVYVRGGTYSEDVTDYVDEGYAAVPSTDDEGETTWTVTDKESADGLAGEEDSTIKASVTYTDKDGVERTKYFEDIAEAFEFANSVSDNTTGSENNVKVTLFDDITIDDFDESFESLTVGGGDDGSANITLDLNGHNFDVSVSVDDDSYFEITGDGTVSGEIKVSTDEQPETSGEFVVSGGTYTEDVSENLADGYVILVGTDEETEETTYTVLTEEEAQSSAAASVTVNDTTTYYETLEDALKAAKEAQTSGWDAGTVTLWDDVYVTDEEGERGTTEIDFDVNIDLNGHVLDTDMKISSGADVGLDLDGGTFSGGVTVGDENGGSEFTVTDSSAYDYEGNLIGAGTGLFDGTITVNGVSGGVEDSDNTASVEGGTFTESVDEFIDKDNYETIYGTDENGDVTYTVVPEGEAENVAGAYVTDSEEKDTYYETFEDALKAAAGGGGTVTLLEDAVCGEEITIEAEVEINLNGHSLEINVVVETDENGSLTITDSSAEEGEDGTGTVTGRITVTGSGDTNNTENPYEESLVFADGTGLSDGLTVDLSDINGGDTEYVMGHAKDDGENDVIAIVPVSDDTSEPVEHTYTAVWTFENGKATLSFVCDCGEWLTDDDGDKVVIDAEVAYTPGEDGTWTFTATVELDEYNEYGASADTYTASWEIYVAASVTDGDETYYFETLDEAAEYASENGLTVKLEDDFDGDLDVSSDVTIDANGHDFGGNVSVDTSATLTVTDTADEKGETCADFEIEDGAKLILDGVDLSVEIVDEILEALSEGSAEIPDGSAIIIASDGSARVEGEDVARSEAAVSVTDGEGNTVYFEDAQDGADALTEGDTLTLWDDADVDFTAPDGSAVDLNGNDLYGNIEVPEGTNFTVTGDGNVFADIDTGDEGNFTAEGGTYAGGAISDGDIADGYVAVVNPDGSVTVMTEEEALETAGAYITDEDGNVTYYADAETAAAALETGDTLTLLEDISFDKTLTVPSGATGVIIDLNGHDVGGICVEDGASVTVTGDGYVVYAEAEDGGSLTLTGGTYGDRESAMRYVGEGYVIFVNSDCTYTVMTKGEAEEKSVAKADVTITYGEDPDGDTFERTLYFEDLQNAVDLASSDVNETDEKKVTLTDDVTGDLEISKDLELDTDGHTLDGDVYVTEGADASFTDSSAEKGDDGNSTAKGEGTITGGIYADDGTSVSVDDVTVEGGIHAGDDTDVDVGGFADIFGGIETGDGSDVTVEGDASVSGGIKIGDGTKDGGGDEYKGSVTVDDNASVEGGIEAGSDTTVTVGGDSSVDGGIETGNSSDVTVKEDASVSGGISTGNGETGKSDGSSVSVEDNATVDGGIETGDASDVEVTDDAQVSGGIKTGDGTKDSTANGSVTVDENAVVEGGIETGDDMSVTVGGNSSVDGGISTGNSSDVTVEDEASVSGGISTGDETGESDGSSVSVGGDATVNGGISTGDETEVSVGGNSTVEDGIETGKNSSVSVIDSASVNGGIDAGENSDVTISGGTFDEKPDASDLGNSDDDDDPYVIVNNGDGTYSVMKQSEAEEISDVYIFVATDEDTGEGHREYYVDFADAVEDVCGGDAAGTIVLVTDVVCDEQITIDGKVEIDLNGHSLTVDIVIDADGENGEPGEGGSLTVSDSSAYDEGGQKKTEGGSGSFAGSVIVNGSGEYEGTDDNPYEDAFTMTDGVTPGTDLSVKVEIGENEEGEKGYYFDETDDGFGIVYGEHTHNYLIAIWEYDPVSGKITLKLLCTCGEYYVDPDTGSIILEPDSSDVTGNDGLYSLSASYTLYIDGEEFRTYTYEAEIQMAAKVVTQNDAGADEELYFETVQDAVNYVMEEGGTIVLTDDVEEDLYVTSDVTLDLNGYDFTGSVHVEEGATFTVTDTSEGENGTFTGSFTADGDMIIDGVGVELTDDSSVSECGSLTVRGDVVIELGENTLDVEGDLVLEDESSLTVAGDEGSELIVSELDVKGASFEAEGDLSVTVTGDVTVGEDGEIDIDVSGDVGIGGDVEVNGGSADIASSEGDVDVSGSVSVSDGGELGLYSDEGCVTVGGDVSVTDEDSPLDIDAADNVEIGGNVSVSEGSAEIESDYADVNIGGDITVTDGGELTVEADDGSVTVDGGVFADGEDTSLDVEAGENIDIRNGVSVSGGAEAELDVGDGYLDVGGDVTVSGNSSFDMTAEDGPVEIGGSVTVKGESSLNVEGDSLDVAGGVSVTEGSEMSVSAEDYVFVGDDVYVGNGSELDISGDSVDGAAVDIYGKTSVEGGTLGLEDVGVTLHDDIVATEDGSVEIFGNTSIDVNGNDMKADITVGGDSDTASLEITDSSRRNTGSVSGSIDVAEGSSLEMKDDTYSGGAVYDEEEESYVVSSEPEIKTTGDYVVGTAADADGETYIVVESVDVHNCGYDFATGNFYLCETTATVYIEYVCTCGEILYCEVELESSDYTATAEFDESGNGTVTVEIAVVTNKLAPNGITYSVIFAGTKTLEDVLTKGENGADSYYTYEPVVKATCELDGYATYTFGKDGIVVGVSLGAEHTGIHLYEFETETETFGLEIYYCEDCGYYFINTTTATTENGYTEGQLEDEISNYGEFVESKESASSELRDALDALLSDAVEADVIEDGEDLYGVKEAVESALAALEELEYEFSGGNSNDYAGALLEAVESILEDARFAIDVAGAKSDANGTVKGIYDEVMSELEDLGLSDDYAETTQNNLNTILDSLERIELEYGDDIESVIAQFLRNARSLLYSFDKKTAETNGDGEGGTASTLTGSVTTDGSGFAGSVDLVIVDADVEFSFVENMIAGSHETVWAAENDSSDDAASYVEGKSVLGVYDISLVDNVTLVKVNVFSGTYTISMLIPGELSSCTGLQIVYVGDDGTIEVFATYVTEDGYLVFTTTHLSEFVLLGVPEDAESSEGTAGEGGTSSDGGEEKDTDLMPVIIALSIVDGTLLILGIILLIVLLMKKGKIGGKKNVASLGIFVLLAIIPSGGIAITVVLGVLALAFIAADIYLIYGIFTAVPVVEYVENATDGDIAVDTTGEVTLSERDDDPEKEE